MSLNRLFEFLVIGLLFGVIEDLIAITLATDQVINLKVLSITLVAALPFAIISELIIDHEKVQQFLKKYLKRR